MLAWQRLLAEQIAQLRFFIANSTTQLISFHAHACKSSWFWNKHVLRNGHFLKNLVCKI